MKLEEKTRALMETVNQVSPVCVCVCVCVYVCGGGRGKGEGDWV